MYTNAGLYLAQIVIFFSFPNRIVANLITNMLVVTLTIMLIGIFFQFGFSKYMSKPEEWINLNTNFGKHLRKLSNVVVVASFTFSFSLFLAATEKVLGLSEDPAWAVPLVITQAAWKLAEVFHFTIQIFELNNDFMLELPATTTEITPQWLTDVLQQAGTLGNTERVEQFEGKILTGGCHFNVSRVNLHYSNAHSETPSTLVVKVLSWDKVLPQKIVLYAKKVLDIPDREAMYLNSYEVESRFYKHYSIAIRGLKMPRVFFNLEDAFNNKFGMIMEDISANENGQPNGFSWEDSRLCLIQIAKFHSAHWGNPVPKKGTKYWDIGGYWTGNKREAEKKDVQPAWQQVQINFKNVLDIKQSQHDLGDRLFKRMNYIAKHFDALSPRTMIHGDYKVSNIFVSRTANADPQVYAIDWQWFGAGSACLDVAYFIATSVHHEHIHKQMELLHLYHHTLTSLGIKNYPFELFMRQFKLCWIDFFMYTIVAKWSQMVPSDVAAYQAETKDGLHLRSYPHMNKLIHDTELFLNQLEAEDNLQ